MKLYRTLSVENGKGLKIKTITILMGFMCFLMILPDDVFGWIPIYRSVTPSSISYRWLDYNFGIIQLLFLFIGIYYIVRLKKTKAFLFIILMLIRELIYFIISKDNVFIASAYEMYLTVFIGYAYVLWAEGGLKSLEESERFFKWFLVSNMLTLYINFAMGGSGGRLAGRYHSSNLDVGGTGTVCVLCFLLLSFGKEKKWYDYIFIALSVIGLLLSGSRANLVLLALILALYYILHLFFMYMKEERRSINRSVLFNRFLIVIFAIVGISIAGFIYKDRIYNWILGSRFQALLSSEEMRSDSSFIGRTASITAGLDVLIHHPLGISGYFINLQTEIRMRGYPTFPHSTLLSMYLVFGPIILIIYGTWIGLLKKLRMIDVKYYMMILFLLISTTVYGGPITNFKIIFMIAMTTFLARRAVMANEAEGKEDD